MAIQGILGKKIGMTQTFSPEGATYHVTAIQAGPCVVTQIKTKVKDGYEAVQLGFEETRKLSSPEKGHLKKTGKLLRHLREFRVDELSDLQVGQQINVGIFQPGDLIDVIGVSKGRGFAGGVKRYHFKGGPKTHGQSDRQRAPGAISSNTFPARIWKGKRMAGHMGDDRVTVKNMKVIQADSERNLLLIDGSVPGGTNGVLIIKKSSKSIKKSKG